MGQTGRLFEAALGTFSQQKSDNRPSSRTKPLNFPWLRSGTTTSVDAEVRAACRDGADGCRVELSGRITIDSSPDLQTLLLRRVESPDCRTLTVDLYDVAYIDTSGLAMLMELLRAARLQAKDLRLSGLRERPRYLLEATRLLHLFQEVDREGRP
ncbi:MAG TPA: STAS domain-containing protein [Verrucomicrobiae bacterium]|nr:STAS domain-containing protein [Verrucomicrobiae bacterium]